MAGMRNGIVRRGGTFSYVIRERDPATGKSKPRWVGGFASHADAKRAKDLANAAQLTGHSVARNRVLFIDFLREWLEAAGVRVKTLSTYRYNVEHYVAPRLGGMALQDVRPQVLTAFYAGLRTDGGRNGGQLGWPSVQSIHATIRTAMTFAVDQQYLSSNPALRAKLPPKPQQRTRLENDGDLRVFTPTQLRTFLTTCRGHRLHALFHLAGCTGARRGELLHLRWQDVDLDRRTLDIQGSRAIVDREVVEGPTKGGRARRIDLSDADVAVLRAHRARQASEQLEAGALWHDAADYLFKIEAGAPIHPDTPSKLMRRLCGEAGVPVIRFHDLRHTHATILLTINTPPHVVAHRLGHQDATVTLKVYAKVLREQSAGLGDAFAAALGQS